MMDDGRRLRYLVTFVLRRSSFVISDNYNELPNALSIGKRSEFRYA
jgi:hypothetical protein